MIAVHECRVCGGEADVPVAAYWYCRVCWDHDFGDLRARWVAEQGGVGFWRHDGLMRPDHGPMWAECRCAVCDATAVAVPGDPCAYCEQRLAATVELQIRRLLHPGELAGETFLWAWKARLDRGIDAGLITRDEARRAWSREAGHVAA